MRAGRRALVHLLACLALALPACRNTEPLENELRTRDIQYRELLDEMARLEGRTQSLERQLAHQRRAGPKSAGEEAARWYGLKRIVLGRSTGGYDNDNLPGDEALQIVLETRDADDRPAKVTGILQITALEVNFLGRKKAIGTWDITPPQLQATWKQGLLSSGYHLILPWRKLPQHEHLRIEARFTLGEGLVYETDMDVKVRLVPGARSNPPIMPPPGILPMPAPLPFPETTTPSPSGVQPAGNWQPAPINQAIGLGRPEPITGFGERDR